MGDIHQDMDREELELEVGATASSCCCSCPCGASLGLIKGQSSLHTDVVQGDNEIINIRISFGNLHGYHPLKGRVRLLPPSINSRQSPTVRSPHQTVKRRSQGLGRWLSGQVLTV